MSGVRHEVGSGRPRADAVDKVTGRARYTGDVDVPGAVHAALVLSTIAAGRVVGIEATAARAVPGVLLVLSCEDDLGLRPVTAPDHALDLGDTGETRLPLADREVHHAGQILAIVVARTPHVARHAADLVRVTYAPRTPVVDLGSDSPEGFEPHDYWGTPLQERRGDAHAALTTAAVTVDRWFSTPIEQHQPMEPHATVACWDDDGGLTVYEGTQWVQGAHKVYADTLGVPRERVRIVSRYIGGGFGAKGVTWGHGLLAAVAARRVGHPVRLVLPRRQMGTLTGHRPRTLQRVRLGASADGRLDAVVHETFTHTSRASDYVEACGEVTSVVYGAPNVAVRHRAVRLDLPAPCHMRTPGEAPGLFALESALDELAATLALDPLELRRRNHHPVDPRDGRPWATDHLLDCYATAARMIGWPGRPAHTGPRARGDEHLGYGVATATFRGARSPAYARVELHPDGTAIVATATVDIGTGSATILAQIAADELGLDADAVQVRMGDSRLPVAPGSFAAQTTASVGAAVQDAARLARERPVADADGVRAAECRSEPDGDADGATSQSFGAVCARVRVDARLGTVRVEHLAGAFDVGRVINPRTTRSQLLGGMIFGLGMALMEEAPVDPGRGRLLARGLADYHVPVSADVPRIEAVMLGTPDPAIGALGARGAGEIGNAGTAGAIANAVYDAVGVRVRDLPLTPDRLLAALAAG